MSVLHITDADRDAAGKIRTLADLLPPAPADVAEPTTTTARPTWRPGRLELAGIVGGLVLAVALIAGLNAFWPTPAPAPRPIPTVLPPTVVPIPTALPTLAPTPMQQDAYAAPDGALMGTIPLSATLVYQDSAHPGWGGISWDGGVVWVRTGQALAALPDLAEPTPAPAPPAWIPPPAAVQVEEPTPARFSTHERPHEEEGPRPPVYFSQPVEPR